MIILFCFFFSKFRTHPDAIMIEILCLSETVNNVYTTLTRTSFLELHFYLFSLSLAVLEVLVKLNFLVFLYFILFYGIYDDLEGPCRPGTIMLLLN